MYLSTLTSAILRNRNTYCKSTALITKVKAKNTINQYLRLVNTVKAGTHPDTSAYNPFWILLNPSKCTHTMINFVFILHTFVNLSKIEYIDMISII